MKDWFIIKNVDEFIDKTRTLVYNKFGSWNDEESVFDEEIFNISKTSMDELDVILPHNEASIIVKQSLKKQTNKKSKKIRYILDDDIFANIVHDLNARMISNLLTSLVNKGLVETSFDSEANDFVFWVKNNDKEKPETN